MVCTLTLGCVFERNHTGPCSPYQGHAITCPGAPEMKGFCVPPCPVAVEKQRQTFDTTMEQLRSQGIASIEADDSRVWFFSRGVIEELYNRLLAEPSKTEVHLVVYKTPAALAAARAKLMAKNPGAC